MQAPDGHDDSMLDPDQRIWGFETNFGGLAEIALVRANQLMPKPPHLTWEEAASMPLVNSTAYRMLVSHNGTQIKQGDIVLIWGAVGGLGGFALQYVLNAGAFPDLRGFLCGEGQAVRDDRGALGDRPPRRRVSVLERRTAHKTSASCAASARRSASSPTARTPTWCTNTRAAKPLLPVSSLPDRAARSSPAPPPRGYNHEYDNRYLWMNKKRIIGSHFANYREAWEANRLVCKRAIHPLLSETYPAGEDRRGCLPRAPQSGRSARSASCAWRRKKGWV